ncbi:MAG: autotransporter-associated beta strand repeat-containing protein [Bacteroidales bacterium]|nr:autotransporter-associated beta strand repeat-containing protein [Bacteroidales bacterium]
MQKKSKAQHRIYGAVAFGAKVLMAMTVWMAVYAVPAGAQTPLPNSGNLSGSYTASGKIYPGPYTLTGNVTITVASGVTAIIDGVISGGSSYSLTKAGAGTLFFEYYINTYSGQTIINAGTLKLGIGGNIVNSPVLINGSGILELISTSKNIKRLHSNSTSAKIILNSCTLVVDNSGYTTTFEGVISGSGGLTLTGTNATLNLLGANTYTGPTTINSSGATLYIGNNSTTGSVAGNILNSGELIFYRTNALTYDKVISGSGKVGKMGAGTLTLGEGNTYTGTTTISNGTLVLGTIGNIANSSGVTIYGDGKLQISANKTIKALSSDVATAEVILGSNTLTIGDNSSTFAGKISGTGGISKSGSGTLTLTGANSYTGATTINAGTLALGTNGTIANSLGVTLYNSGKLSIAGNKTIKALSSGSSGTEVTLGSSSTLTINNSSACTFVGVISGTGGITKSESATLTLNGANTYTGLTTINAGTIVLDTNGTIAASSGVTLSGSGKLEIKASKTIKALNSSSSTSSVLLGTSTLTIGTSGGSDGGGAFAGVISGISGIGIIKNGSATLTLNGANTYTGLTTINAGTIVLSATGTIASTNGVTMNGGTLDISAGNKTINGLSSSSSTSKVVLGGSTLTIDTGTFNGIISGTGGITKYETGTFTLNGANTYTGATTINAGMLLLGINGTIATSSGVTLSGSGEFRLSMGAGSKTIKSLNSSSTTARVELNGNTLIIGTSTTSNDGGGTFAGAISDGNITKQGTATLTLDGINSSYTGATTINAGTLALGTNGAITNSSGVTLNGSAEFRIYGNNNKSIKSLNGVNYTAVTFYGVCTLTIGTSGGSNGGGTFSGTFEAPGSGYSGSVTKQGNATLTLDNPNCGSYANGTFTASQGTVVLGGEWGGDFVKNSGSTLTVNGNRFISGTLTMNGGTTNFNLSTSPTSRLWVSGALTKSGTNTLNITALGSETSYVVLSAASGVNTDNFDATGAVGVLSATATELSFIPTTGFIAVTDIADLPETAAINVPLTLSGTVIPVNATNQTIVWTVTNPGSTGGAITGGNIFTATATGTATLKATIANGVSPVEAYEQTFTLNVVTATLDGTVTLSGIPIFGEVLVATPSLTSTPVIPDLGALTYEWLRDGNVIAGAPNLPVYTLAAGDVGAAISVRVTAANCTGSVTSESTATIEKAPQDPPAAPTLADKTATAITLTTVAGCEYSRDYGTWQSSPTFAGLSPNTPYLFTQRYAETATHYASPESPAALFTTDDSDNPLYTITATVNDTDHGTITPYGAATVEEGDNITFHITAYAGYHIETVLVDGANNPNAVATGAYTFQNVTEDHTIHVTFAEGVGITAPPSPPEGGDVRVYPNPTSGALYVDCMPTITITNIEIFDVMGRTVLATHTVAPDGTHRLQIGASGATSPPSGGLGGAYFLRITTENGVVTKKVIKN